MNNVLPVFSFTTGSKYTVSAPLLCNSSLHFAQLRYGTFIFLPLSSFVSLSSQNGRTSILTNSLYGLNISILPIFQPSPNRINHSFPFCANVRGFLDGMYRYI